MGVLDSHASIQQLSLHVEAMYSRSKKAYWVKRGKTIR